MIIFEEKGMYTFTFDEIEVGEVFYHIAFGQYYLRVEENHDGIEIFNAVNLIDNTLEEVNDTEQVKKCDAHLVIKSRTE